MEHAVNDIDALVREEKRLTAVESHSEAWAEGLSAGIEPEIIAMVEALTPETYAWADGLDKLRETLDAITKPGFRQKVGKRDERGWAGPTGAPR